MATITEYVRQWQDKRSDPSSYDYLHARFGRGGLRADNISYTSRSSFTFGKKRFHEIQCDLNLPQGGRPHITYYEPYPSLYLRQGMSPAAREARRSTSPLWGMFRRKVSKYNRAYLAGNILRNIRDIVPDLSVLKNREEEIGRQEHIVVVALHGGGQPWVVGVERDKLVSGFTILGTIDDLVTDILRQKGKTDRIILATCNENKATVMTDVKGVRINYALGVSNHGTPTDPRFTKKFFEYNSDTHTVAELPGEHW